MFTGIIETIGKVKSVKKTGTNISFCIESPLSSEFKIDQSISHNGVCLTVESIKGNQHTVTAIEETINKTNLIDWLENTIVNIERCMPMNGRLDGHIVQGHVDAVAICTNTKTLEGSWEYTFEFDKKHASLIIEKGSIAVNGTSLTCFNVGLNCFTVAIIPYTFNHTSIGQIVVGSKVNIEFDIVGKYIGRMLQLQQTT